jgi:hypothetical protein
MKLIFALCAAVLIAGSVALYRATRPASIYGSFEKAPQVEVARLIARPKDYMKQTVAIEGLITKQCTTMGCFFFFEADGKTLRVDLAEIAMHAPKNRNGRRARVEGWMVPYGDGYQFWASAVEFQ